MAIVLKLKSYTKLCELNFKETIRELSNIKTVRNRINDKIGQLFTQMELKFPNRI